MTRWKIQTRLIRRVVVYSSYAARADVEGRGAARLVLGAAPVGTQDGDPVGRTALYPSLPSVRGGRPRAQTRRMGTPANSGTMREQVVQCCAMQAAQFSVHAAIEERHWWFLGRRRIVTTLVRRLIPPSTTTSIVDIGCGTGGNIEALARDYACIGIDPSAEAIELARSRFPHARFLCGSTTEALQQVQARASLFLLMDVLEHVPDDVFLLSSLLAGVEPGAYVLLTVPADMRLWTEHDVSFGHYRRYDAARLARTWSGLPVTPLLLSYYNSRLYPIVRGVRTLNRWRGRASGMAGTDFAMPPPPVNAWLSAIFAGEAARLVDVLERRRSRGFARGVSLIAVLRREPGVIQPRNTPPDLEDVPHEPR